MKITIVIISSVVFSLTLSAAMAHGLATKPIQATRIVVPIPPEQTAFAQRALALEKSAVAYMKVGNYPAAEFDANQAIDTGHGLGTGEEIIAAICVLEGRTQEAQSMYEHLVEDEGSNEPRNLLPYALLELKSGNWNTAVNAYNEALPLVSEGRLLVAHSSFSPLVVRNSDLEAALHLALGLTYSSGEFTACHSATDQALSEYKKALSLKPQMPLANLCYAQGLQAVKRNTEAAEAFQKAEALAGNNSSEADVKSAAAEAISLQRYSPSN